MQARSTPNGPAPGPTHPRQPSPRPTGPIITCPRPLGATIVLLGLVGGLLVGCKPGGNELADTRAEDDPDRLVVGVSLMNLSSEFIVMLDQALQAKATELDVRLIVNDAQRSAAKQVQHAENFVAQGVDAIILNPCEVEASSPAVDKALAAGVPVVNVNSETRSSATAFVGSRDEDSARMAMGYIAERLNGSGSVVMMHGFMGQAAQIKRDLGAKEVLATFPDLNLLAEQTAEWDRAKAMSLMENWIQSYGDRIDAVFAQNDEMGMGALIALERANLKDQVVVASVDAIADALEAVRSGRLDATVFQDARGQAATALDTACRIARGQPYDAKSLIPFRLVTRDNVQEYLE